MSDREQRDLERRAKAGDTDASRKIAERAWSQVEALAGLLSEDDLRWISGRANKLKWDRVKERTDKGLATYARQLAARVARLIEQPVEYAYMRAGAAPGMQRVWARAPRGKVFHKVTANVGEGYAYTRCGRRIDKPEVKVGGPPAPRCCRCLDSKKASLWVVMGEEGA